VCITLFYLIYFPEFHGSSITSESTENAPENIYSPSVIYFDYPYGYMIKHNSQNYKVKVYPAIASYTKT
jgi:hypothetical protein